MTRTERGTVQMKIIGIRELEHLVRETFPAKGIFSAESELGLHGSRAPVVSFVHGGPDPFLDRQIDAWLAARRSSLRPTRS